MAETTLEIATRTLGARTDLVLELLDDLKDVLFWIKTGGDVPWVNTTLIADGTVEPRSIIGRTDFDLFEPYLANQYQIDDAGLRPADPIAGGDDRVPPYAAMAGDLEVAVAQRARAHRDGCRHHGGGEGSRSDEYAWRCAHIRALPRAGQHSRDGGHLGSRLPFHRRSGHGCGARRYLRPAARVRMSCQARLEGRRGR
jgi:hypothetical protein